jgi:hypothetical protein
MRLRGFAGNLRFAACAALALGVVCWMCAGRDGSVIRAAGSKAQIDAGASRRGAVPVLVELFTAEGCSSCPPADALLGVLDRRQPVANARIIVLGEHVTYWNNGGWRDRFSLDELTARQEDYQYFFKLDDVYTPQAVVNGSAQLNGSDAKGIEVAIEKAAAYHPVPLQIASVQVRGKEVTFTLRNGMPTTPGNVNLYAALVDPEDTTEVRGGENKGRTLQHVGVVRVLNRVGSSLRTQSLGEKPFVFRGDVPGKTALDGMRLVVFVQTKQIGPVLGADACLISSAPAATGSGTVSACPNSGG